MPLGLLGKKLGHTRVYDANGELHAVTVVQEHHPNPMRDERRLNTTIAPRSNVLT